MSQVRAQFSDKHMKMLYANLLNHLNNLTPLQKNDTIVVYNELLGATLHSLNDPNGELYKLGLAPSEKIKACAVFEAIYQALPCFYQLSPEEKSKTIIKLNESYKKNPTQQVVYVYKFHDSLIYNWLFINSITPGRFSKPVVHAHVGMSTSNEHHHHSENKKSENILAILAFILVILVAAIVLILAMIATYYMLNQFMEGVERLWYNEGWMKATLLFASSVAGGATSTIISLLTIAVPLSELALFAGLSPVILVPLVITSIAVISGAIACFTTAAIYNYYSEKANQDALDPADPFRFRLTESEVATLCAKGIDPITVKCAIIALRSEIVKVQGYEEMPSFFSRLFDQGKVSNLLQDVRKLRNGSKTKVEVGGLIFQCKNSEKVKLPEFLSDPSAPSEEREPECRSSLNHN